MKKILYLLIALFAAAMMFVTGCNKGKEKEPEKTDVKSAGTFTQTQLIDAFAGMYDTWLGNTTLPSTLSVGGKELTHPQYQYALCKLLTNLKEGKDESVDVLSCKAADHPDRDSYDKETIAVVNGPANTIENGATEDIADIARRMLAVMVGKGQVPNQTLFKRGGTIAFSTNRAIVSMARVIAAYKAKGELPKEVSTEYLSASATLKGFAQQLVSYLDVWENTIGTVSADGSHCSDNGSAWQNVHFIPIPHSGGVYADGKDQYAEAFRPYRSITVANVEYTASQCFIIALKGILDLVTLEGSAKTQTERNTLVHTPGNGKSFSQPIPTFDEWAVWGSYPWYEKADDDFGVINFSDERPCTVDVLVKFFPWYLTRSSQLKKIGNFQCFGDNPESSILNPPYQGEISAMRTFLIAIRFYKYLLDNNITENVYSATKDVELNYDLYGIVIPDIELRTKELSVKASGKTAEATFVARKDWAATPSDSWITVDPASGKAGSPVTIKITVAANEGAAREGNVAIKGGNVQDGLAIKIDQEAYEVPTNATIKDFAQQFVTILDVWEQTTGTVNTVTGLDSANPNYNPDFDVENAHYVSDETTITVAGKTYGTADMCELAMRCYMLLRGFDGNFTEKYGIGSVPTIDPAGTMSTALPETHAYKWGSLPYNESGSTAPDGTTTGNGGPLMKGNPADPDNALANVVTLDIMDNFTERSMNWPITKGTISNCCSYPRSPITGYYGCFSVQRAFLTFARIFKYALGNNLDNLANVPVDQLFDSDLLGVSSAAGNKEFVNAIASAYGEFVKTDELPKTVNVKGKTYSKAEYIAAGCMLLMKSETDPDHWLKGGIQVPDVSESTNNQWNTYDPDEISLKDMQWQAKIILTWALEHNGVFPNYCTMSGEYVEPDGTKHKNRLTFNNTAVIIARLFHEYLKNSSLPEKVSSWQSDFLRKTANCETDSPVVLAAMNEATAGKTTVREKAEALFNYSRDKWEWENYNNTKKGSVKTIQEKGGNCCDLSHALIAMARAAGIPARYMHGQCQFSSSVIGHVFVEMYVDGVWFICDPSNNSNTFGHHNWTHMATFNGRYKTLPF